MRRLPTFLFVFLEDLIFTSPELYLASEIETQLRWIFKTIDQHIRTRKTEMPKKAVRPLEPQVYIIKSLPRYNFARMTMSFNEFTYRQEKFNNMVEQIGRCYGFGTINCYSIDPSDRLCFDEAGSGRQLSHRGMYRFWRELLQTIACMDRDKDINNRRKIMDEEERRRDKSRFGNTNRRY